MAATVVTGVDRVCGTRPPQPVRPNASAAATAADCTRRYLRLPCASTCSQSAYCAQPPFPFGVPTQAYRAAHGCAGLRRLPLESPVMSGQNWDRRAFIEALGTVTAGALVAPPTLGAA